MINQSQIIKYCLAGKKCTTKMRSNYDFFASFKAFNASNFFFRTISRK
jgi:hypothetical protein